MKICNKQLFAFAVPSIGNRGAAIMWMPSAPCCCSTRCHPRRSGALVGCCCRSWASEEQVSSSLLLSSSAAVYSPALGMERHRALSFVNCEASHKALSHHACY